MGRDVLVLGLHRSARQVPPAARDVGEAEAIAAFREQAEALLEGGVDGFVAETFSDLRELRLAVTAIRGVSADLPVVAQMAFNDERVTFLGQAPAEVARELAALPGAGHRGELRRGVERRSTTWGWSSTSRRPGPGCRSGRTPGSRAGTASG